MTAGPIPDSDIAALDAGVASTTLASGTAVVTDPMPGAYSASIAVWVGVGSRDETDGDAGISHFLEHLAFKGTMSRSARDINRAIDGLGGEFNAYTSKESTVYLVRVPSDGVAVATDLLFDVVCGPRLDSRDVDVERDVILEELSAAQDNPDDVVFENLMAGLFPEHSLGREIIGTTDSLLAIDRDALFEFHSARYCGPSVVVAAAGGVGHDDMVALARDRFEARSAVAPAERRAPGECLPHQVREGRPIEQVHMAQGWRSLAAGSPQRFALAVLSHVLGDGPSSRLYERIREDRGLAYSIGTGIATHVDSGTFSVHCATSPGHLDEVRSIVADTIGELIADGPTDEELAVAKGYLRGSMRVGLEDSGGRMMRIGAEMTSRRTVTPIAEILDALAAVTPEDVRLIAREVIGTSPVESVVGPG